MSNSHETKYDVFISYSRSDSVFADKLNQDLVSHGLNVWRDVNQLMPGDNWAERIAGGLSDSAALILIASERSVDSPWILREIVYFLDEDKLVIPVVLDDAGAAALPASLRYRQWVDFRDGYDQRKIAQLVAVLHRSGNREAIPAPTIPISKGYVFFNYAEEDTGFAEQLRVFLASKGYGYWDYQDSERDYHTDLDLELESIIKNASAVVSLISPDWKRSKWTRKEYLFSEDVGVPVFLLKVVDPGPTLITSGGHFIDFTRGTEAGYLKLAAELKRKGL